MTCIMAISPILRHKEDNVHLPNDKHENFKWAIAMVPRKMVATCPNPNNFIVIGIKCGNDQMISLNIIAVVSVFQPLHCSCKMV